MANERATGVGPGQSDRFSDLLQQACQQHQRGELDAAEENYRVILERQPQHAEALANLGSLFRAKGDNQAAIDCYQRALKIAPGKPWILANLGHALLAAGMLAEAITAFGEAAALSPGDVTISIARAQALRSSGRTGEAVDLLKVVLAREPGHWVALDAMGQLLLSVREWRAALPWLEQAVRIEPGSVRVLNNLGIALLETGQTAKAKERFEAATRLAPREPRCHHNLGNAVRLLEGPAAAAPHLQRAVELDPRYAKAWYALGGARDLMGMKEAAHCFQQVLQIDREHLGALAWCLADAGKRGDLKKAEELSGRARMALQQDLSRQTDWQMLANLAYGSIFLPWSGSERTLLTARIDQLLTEWSRSQEPLAPSPLPTEGAGRRLRVGYLSPNFRDHPVGHVTVSLFPNHRRDRFEVHGFSTAIRPDHPVYTGRFQRGFDAFHSLSRLSPRLAAQAIRDAGIDILVDLDGYMDCSSPPILALRPAPVQVFWLGHAGGLGLSCIDHLIADDVVVPRGEDRDYRERVERLPNVYHCADTPDIHPNPPTRAECALPAAGFVFCAFNNPQKILPPTFDSWMRILRRVEGSCLWLSRPARSPDAVANLRNRAQSRGVAPERLVFAERLPNKSLHLARHVHAGLFLDTVGSLSASTTALDALWAGVPLLTVRGDWFASRIATTFLHCLGLDELVCQTLQEYEAKAVQIAQDAAEARRLAERLRQAKSTAPLFRPESFVRDLEALYERLWAERKS